MAWQLEWVSGEVDRLWPEGVPQIRNEHGSAYVTGYAHDEAGNRPQLRWGVYLGMVGHKTVLESIRATVQAKWRHFYQASGGRMFVVCDNRSRMQNLRSEINYCLGNRSLVVSLTNLVDLPAGKRGEGDRIWSEGKEKVLG